MKKYLDNTFFTYTGIVDGRFYNYTTTDKNKGEITIEVSLDQDTAEIVHNDTHGNSFSYEVLNQKELQDTIEYILGKKVISEDQWKQNNNTADVNSVLEDWDDEVID
jgi:hypothetical protein